MIEYLFSIEKSIILYYRDNMKFLKMAYELFLAICLKNSNSVLVNFRKNMFYEVVVLYRLGYMRKIYTEIIFFFFIIKKSEVKLQFGFTQNPICAFFFIFTNKSSCLGQSFKIETFFYKIDFNFFFVKINTS